MDRSTPTTGQGQRSAIGGQPKFNFPKSQLEGELRNLNGYVLISDQGQVWSSEQDQSKVDNLIRQVMPQFESAR